MPSFSLDALADDWVASADAMRLNPANGTASVSFRMGSPSIRIAALVVIAGKVSGNPVPDSMNFVNLQAVFMNVPSGPFSISSLHGRKGDIVIGTKFANIGSAISPVAFRRNGKILFNAEIPLVDSSEFQIAGQWILLSGLNFADTFIVPNDL